MNMRKLTRISFVLITWLFLATHSATAQTIPASNGGDQIEAGGSSAKNDGTQTTLHRRNWRYTVHASDTLEIDFTLTPDFNQTVTVQPDGFITLKGVGDINAAGQSIPALTEAVKAAYSKVLRDPLITINPKEFEKPFFIVGGQVGKPGKFDLRGDVTLTQAIAIAGGFTDASKHSQVLLFRRVSDQWTEAKIINTKQMLNSRNLQEDPELQPGDMLFVPKNFLSKIKPFLPTTSAGVFYNPAMY